MTRDVHRALERLEEYHADLFRTTDFELKHSIESIINTFKTGLFTALCDIDDFYSQILLNERLSFGQKTLEAQNFARRWEAAGPNLIGRTKPLGPFPVTTYSRPSSAFGGSNLGQPAQVIDTYSREYELMDVTIDASRAGLGFSISGGTDRDSTSIQVTNISQGGAVAADGRVRVGDIIIQVNDTDTTFVPHARAVQALNEAGQLVRLVLKREKSFRSYSQSQLIERTPLELRPVHKTRSLHQLPQQQSILTQPRPSSRLSYGTPQQTILVEGPRVVLLRKGDSGLGFNIVGGESGEPIFISHIVPGGVADLNGQVKRGDVLLRVNDSNLIGATHSSAAIALKSIPPNSFVELQLHYRPKEADDFFRKLERQSQVYLNQQGLR